MGSWLKATKQIRYKVICISFATFKERPEKRMKKLLILIALPLALVSCSTDFDTIADYKEIMVAYGLLNQYDTVQVIKVNKAFLGEGNALIMAGQKDSINYPDILEVTLDRIDNGTVTASYTLQFDTTTPKDPGVFHNPYQVLYKLRGHQLSLNSQYKLKIRNTVSGVEATSQSAVLGNCVMDEPDSIDKFNFTSALYPSVQLLPAARGKIYNMYLRFHYLETDTTTGITTAKYFDWKFFDQVVDPATVTGIRYVVPGPDFYLKVGQNIPINPNVTRHAGNPAVANGWPLEVFVTAGSEDLYRYMQLSSPSSTVVQERPVFSNIQNGVGLFTGRLDYSTYRDMTTSSKLALDTSQHTKDLNFQ